MRKLLILLSLFTFTSCGPGQNTNKGMKPNFIGQGFSLYVEQTSFNTYKFTVVENQDHKGAVFTVYGLIDESQIASFNKSARARLPHVADGDQSGDSFEVTFNNDDAWFAVFEDEFIGGSFSFATNIEMIRGQFRN